MANVSNFRHALLHDTAIRVLSGGCVHDLFHYKLRTAVFKVHILWRLLWDLFSKM